MPRSPRRRTIEVPTWLYLALTAEAAQQDRTLADLCLQWLIQGLNQAERQRAAPSPTAHSQSATPAEREG